MSDNIPSVLKIIKERQIEISQSRELNNWIKVVCSDGTTDIKYCPTESYCINLGGEDWEYTDETRILHYIVYSLKKLCKYIVVISENDCIDCVLSLFSVYYFDIKKIIKNKMHFALKCSEDCSVKTLEYGIDMYSKNALHFNPVFSRKRKWSE